MSPAAPAATTEQERHGGTPSRLDTILWCAKNRKHQTAIADQRWKMKKQEEGNSAPLVRWKASEVTRDERHSVSTQCVGRRAVPLGPVAEASRPQ